MSRGALSPETVQWCVEHRYPYIGLGAPLGPTCDLWDFYADEVYPPRVRYAARLIGPSQEIEDMSPVKEAD